ncbi:MAG: SH3 domain-containing protein, partial [Planctomycetota bacterium]
MNHASMLTNREDNSRRAVVTVPVESMLAAPGLSMPVVSQTILGETVSVLQQTTAATTGFVEIQTHDGYRGWVSAASLSSWPADGPAYAADDDATIKVASIFANIYSEPDFTKGKPLMRLTMGTRIEAAGIVQDPAQSHSGFIKIKLPSKAIAYIPKGDASPPFSCSVSHGPQAWIALGKQLLGT